MPDVRRELVSTNERIAAVERRVSEKASLITRKRSKGLSVLRDEHSLVHLQASLDILYRYRSTLLALINSGLE
jgi:hypothetical protein